MIAFDAGAGRKVRRTAENEIEPFLTESVATSEVGFADRIAIGKSVVDGRLSGERYALSLGFDCHEPCAGQTPGGDHSHRSNPRAEIQHAFCCRHPCGAVPRGQHIVSRKAMAASQLVDAE